MYKNSLLETTQTATPKHAVRLWPNGTGFSQCSPHTPPRTCVLSSDKQMNSIRNIFVACKGVSLETRVQARDGDVK